MSGAPPPARTAGRFRTSAVLAVFFLAGALHWVLFLDSGRGALTGPSSTVQDWPKEFRYYTVLQQGVREGRVPYFLSQPIIFSRKFLAIPEVTWSPQIALLRVLPIPSFIVLNTVLLYAAGFVGLLLLRRRHGLGLLPFALLFLLFDFNGHVTAHLAAGHSMWAGYFLLPFFFLQVLGALEDASAPGPPLGLALLLFALLLQGAFHIFVWCVLFLLLLAAFNPRRWRGVATTLCWAAALCCCRLVPAVFVANRREQTFLTGFPSVAHAWHALATIRDAAFGKRGGFFGELDWWEYDTYLGFGGILWLATCGIGLAFRRRDALRAGAERALSGPMAVMALLSMGDAYLVLNVSHLPLLSSQRVASRLLILPMGFLMVLAAIRMQRLLEEAPSRAIRWLGIGVAAATAAALAAHSWTWKVSAVESLVRPHRAIIDVEIVDPARALMTPGDRAYLATVRVSAVVSLGALLALALRSRRLAARRPVDSLSPTAPTGRSP